MSFQFWPKHLHAEALAHVQRQPLLHSKGAENEEVVSPVLVCALGWHAEEKSTTEEKRTVRKVGRQLATQIGLLRSFAMKAFVCQQEDVNPDPLFYG